MTKSLNDRINELQEKLEQVTAERDALAAHTKELSSNLIWIAEVVETDFIPNLEDYIELQEHIDSIKGLANQSYQNGLAEHDAEVARKAILAVTQQPDSIISRLPDSIWISARGVRSFADTYANKIRNGKDGG